MQRGLQGYGYVPLATMPDECLLAQWHRQQGASLQLLTTEVVPVPSSHHVTVGSSLQLLNRILWTMYSPAVLRGDGPRWQPLFCALSCVILVKRQSESIVAGGNGHGSRQLRPGRQWHSFLGCGDCLWCRQHGSSALHIELGFKLYDFCIIQLFCIIQPCIL
jgi:hypothetical protein